MKNFYTKLIRSDDVLVQLPEGWGEEGEKVSIHEENGNIIISKMCEIEIDLDDQTFKTIALLAHEKDITFNEMVTELLTEFIEKEKFINNTETFENTESVL